MLSKINKLELTDVSFLSRGKPRDIAFIPAVLKARKDGDYRELSHSVLKTIGPLQLGLHVVQNRRAEEQKSHWDKTNKENYRSMLCMSFVSLVLVRLLLSSVAVLYHVNA